MRIGLVGVVAACLVAPVHGKSGKDVYAATCAACHASGVAGAPRFGDRDQWAGRAAAGRDALAASVIKGKGAMPPRGGNAGLSDSDIRNAVDFMLKAVR